MSDIWSFLLQTLTASGAAALVLAVKWMFRDKLSPRWQFAVWGVPALVLLVPAASGGRYVLVNWPLFVEFLRSLLTGEFGALAHVSVPIPLPRFDGPPRTGAAWLYAVYLAGVVFLLGRYILSYLHLRLALRRGTPAGESRQAVISGTAERYGLPACPAVEVPGLDSAFICGAFRPVLALPVEEETDEKVILHELLHLKHRDTAWGILICLLRCLHWCNPLLWYCADLAGNDLEALCDQRVLELLEGEDRRDYGRILLSMANEKYARAPGTSSMANGGRNIRRRIEAIARFKRYPAGMALASVCVALVLAGPCLTGTRAQSVYMGDGSLPQRLRPYAAMASARTAPCTTYAGAFDTYAKAVLTQCGAFRAMCAPLADQDALAAELRPTADSDDFYYSFQRDILLWDSGLEAKVSPQYGYQIYNLTPVGNCYEGLLTVDLEWSPALGQWDGTVHSRYLAVQPLRAEKQDGRWVILPLGDFQVVQGDEQATGNRGLPARVYEAQYGDFTLQMRYQTKNCIAESYKTQYDLFYSAPLPNGQFTSGYYDTSLTAIYIGDPERRDELKSVGAACAPMSLGGERPELGYPGTAGTSGNGSSSDGSGWGSTDTSNWETYGDEIPLGGGGSGGSGGSQPWEYLPPEAYAADLYINGGKVAELTLLPTKGGLS